jgi:hypothetical protein
MTIEHNEISTGELHEVKGAAASTLGQVLTSTGGAAAFATPSPASGSTSQGVYDYNDVTTASTAIPLTLAATAYKLTNDAAGSSTNTTYSLVGLDNVWEGGSTNQFDWTVGAKLALGDTADIRFDVEYTTTAVNTEIRLELHLGVGHADEYVLPVIGNENMVAVGTYRRVVSFGLYMGDTTTLDYPGEVWARASKTGTTVKVNGWYIRVLHTNV